MTNLVTVGISDQKIAVTPDILITYALGSCVGICLYDKMKRIAGLAHILLPESSKINDNQNIYKFADTAIPELVRQMESKGCVRGWITAKIAGGANMFKVEGKSIGEKNVESVKRELQRLNIRIIAEDTGGNYGRTVEFNPENGIVTVRSSSKGNKVI